MIPWTLALLAPAWAPTGAPPITDIRYGFLTGNAISRASVRLGALRPTDHALHGSGPNANLWSQPSSGLATSFDLGYQLRPPSTLFGFTDKLQHDSALHSPLCIWGGPFPYSSPYSTPRHPPEFDPYFGLGNTSVQSARPGELTPWFSLLLPPATST
jgi:hypothetical protein